MRKFTVILLRPKTIAEPYGQDIYVANVEAEELRHAIEAAKNEVFRADAGDYGDDPDVDFTCTPDDYALLVAFEGHHVPLLFGWQV